ncbi:MAG TPA: hypothetical protein VGR73_12135 [Bryobacteraceae bacterium]|nr:hypothetical protein [Bryobacteraceae bacterium]
MTLDSLHRENANLRQRLDRLLAHATPPGGGIHVLVTVNEINDRHGTGPLVERVLAGAHRVLSIRARSDYGFQEFGEWSTILSHKGKAARQVREDVRQLLAGRRVERVLCVPYQADELLTAIAIHDLCQAPVCIWIMDDQNIATRSIPDELMREALHKSSLRLATHPELARAYERKFGLPFHILPAVVPDRLVAGGQLATAVDPPRPVLIGSIWEQVWFDRLCDAMEGSGFNVDWFGNYRSLWVRFSEQALARAGIRRRGVIPEEQLADELRRSSFVIVPVSPLDGADSNPGIARLSLPGRILFTAASSSTPALVVGSEMSCAARFVKHFGVGEVIPYDRESFCSAAARLIQPGTQAALRGAAARLGPALSDRGVSRWLFKSTVRGAPVDRRFEDLFADYPLSNDPVNGLATGEPNGRPASAAGNR